MRRTAFTLCAAGASALVLLLTGGFTTAGEVEEKCDFLTGGGFIFPSFFPGGARANFGVGGGCKHGSPTWGHLNYLDHGLNPPLHVHWETITAYFEGGTGADPQTGQPTGVRFICGTARTNQLYGDVYFVVRTRDDGEPGVNDEFDIILRDRLPGGAVGPIVYDTLEGFPHRLGGGVGGGGNIQLHKPNPSTTGVFGGPCPALTG